MPTPTALTSGQVGNASSATTAAASTTLGRLQTLAIATTPGSGKTAGLVVDGWLKVAERNFNSGDLERSVYLYTRAGTGTSITATIRTADNRDYEEIRWSWVEWQDVSAVLQPTSAAGNSSAPSVTLAAFQNALNATLEVIGSASGLNPTVGTGFTQLHEVSGAVQGDFLTVGWQNANDTSVDASSSTGSDFWGILGAELATGTFTDGNNTSGTGPRVVPLPSAGPMSAGSIGTFLLGTAASGVQSGTVAETVTLAAAQSAQADFVVARAEAATITDSQAGSASFVADRTETVTLADSQSATLTFSVQRDESIALSDSQSAIATFAATTAETIGLADSQSATAVFEAARAEAFAVTDAQSASADVAAAAAESVAITDSQDATVTTGGGSTFNDSREEAVTLADSQSAVAVFDAQRAEALSLADAQAAAADQEAALGETFALSDAQDATVVGALDGQVDEAISLSDEQDATVDSGIRRSGVTHLWRTLEHMPERIDAQVAEGFTLTDEADAAVVQPLRRAPVAGEVSEALQLGDAAVAAILRRIFRDETGLIRTASAARPALQRTTQAGEETIEL